MATAKQKKAAEILVVKGGNVSQAMREAGYDENTVNTPSKLTESKGFQELMVAMGVSDKKLAQVLDDGLGATRAVVMGKESTDSFVDVQPDFAIRHKYLETALRLKGLQNNDGNTTYSFHVHQAEQKAKYDL